MITVHHLNNSRSQRVIWLLEELGLAYEIVPYTRDPGGMAPAAMRAVHPLGKAPIIEQDGTVMAESGAILEHLAAGTALMPPDGSEAHRRARYFLHYAEGSAMPNLLLRIVFDQIEAGPVPFYVRPVVRGLARAVKGALVDPQLALHLDFLEAELADRPWFAGEAFSVADIQMSFPLQGAAAKAGLDGARPNLMAWLDRIQARPAWTRAIERGGAFDLG